MQPVASRGGLEMDAGGIDEADVDLLELDGETSLDLPASSTFDLGSSGTIEFVVLADWNDDPGYFPCVLASRSAYDGDDPSVLAAMTRYSVHISGDRKSIGLWNGVRWAGVPFEFGDGRFHRVALVTRETSTTVYVDGENRGELVIGYGAGAGLPFHVGSSDGASEFFVGALSGVRIWRAALEPETLARLASYPGPPPPDDPSLGELVALSSFTESEPTLLVSGTGGE